MFGVDDDGEVVGAEGGGEGLWFRCKLVCYTFLYPFYETPVLNQGRKSNEKENDIQSGKPLFDPVYSPSGPVTDVQRSHIVTVHSQLPLTCWPSDRP